MIGDAGWGRSLTGLGSLAAAAAVIATGALADGGSGTCPAVWAEYVETVGEIVAPLGPDFPLLFVSREGEVYDCLGLVRDAEFIARAAVIEKALPIDRTSVMTTDPASWPTTMCTEAYNTLFGLNYFLVYLPLELEILASRDCQMRIYSGTQRIASEAGTNDR